MRAGVVAAGELQSCTEPAPVVHASACPVSRMPRHEVSRTPIPLLTLRMLALLTPSHTRPSPCCRPRARSSPGAPRTCLTRMCCPSRRCLCTLVGSRGGWELWRAAGAATDVWPRCCVAAAPVRVLLPLLLCLAPHLLLATLPQTAWCSRPAAPPSCSAACPTCASWQRGWAWPPRASSEQRVPSWQGGRGCLDRCRWRAWPALLRSAWMGWLC